MGTFPDGRLYTVQFDADELDCILSFLAEFEFVTDPTETLKWSVIDKLSAAEAQKNQDYAVVNLLEIYRDYADKMLTSSRVK